MSRLLQRRHPRLSPGVSALSALLLVAALSVVSLGPVEAATNGALTRYPYLTDSIQTSITVNWATTRAATTASVKWGPAGSCSQHTTTATSSNLTVGSVAEYQWKAVLPVSPDTAYCYRVFLGSTDLLGTDPSPGFTSQVAKGSSAPFDFAVFGDWGQAYAGSANADQANVLSRIAQSGSRFAVMTGDTAYPNGDQKNYGDLQQTGTDLSAVFAPQFWGVPGRSVPVFNVTGNHGFSNGAFQVQNWPEQNAASTSGGRYQMESYPAINGSTPHSYPSMWYAFDAGNARFYVLTAAWADGNVGTGSVYLNDAAAHFRPGDAEYEWLKADLAAHPGGVKMAFWHYPLYADSSGQPSDTALQGSAGTLQGLLDANNVQLVFNGHAHGYERNRPDSAGLVSYVVGNGGAALGSVSGCSAFDLYAIGSGGSHCGAAPRPTSNAEVFGFLKVHVDGQQVTVTPTSSTGRTYDVQTYTVPGNEPDSTPPTVPSGVTLTNPARGTTHVTWAASTDNVGVTGYSVYRNPGPVGAPSGDVLVGTVSGSTTSFDDTAVAPGTGYGYRVSATDAAGNTSALSATASTTALGPADTAPPSTPGNLTATAPSTSVVNLAWSSSTDDVRVIGYRISRDGTTLKDVPDNATTYSDETAEPGTTYTYRVSAFDATDNLSTPATVTVTTPPATQTTTVSFRPSADSWVDQANPTLNHGTATRLAVDNSPVNDTLLKFNVTGTGTGTSCPTVTAAKLTLTVGSSTSDNSVRGGDFYATSRNDPNAGWTETGVNWNNAPAATGSPVATIAGAVALNSAYTVDVSPLVTGNGTITIRVKSPSSDGARYYSKEGSTTSAPDLTLTCTGGGGGGGDTVAPTAPGNLAAGTPTATTVPLTWAASTDNVGVTGYEVYRDNGTTPVATPTGTSYTDTGLSPSTTYHYTVKAHDAAGNRSTASNTVTVTTQTGAGGGTVTLTPVADRTIDTVSTSPTIGRLKVDASSPVNDMLMRFTAPASCGNVTAATLRLTVGNGTNDPSVRGGDFYATSPNDPNADWSETSVVWNTAPAKDTGIAPVSLTGAVTANTSYTLNVTRLVPTAGGTFTLRGSSTSGDGAGYYSKEGSTTLGPTLTLTCS